MRTASAMFVLELHSSLFKDEYLFLAPTITPPIHHGGREAEYRGPGWHAYDLGRLEAHEDDRHYTSG